MLSTLYFIVNTEENNEKYNKHENFRENGQNNLNKRFAPFEPIRKARQHVGNNQSSRHSLQENRQNALSTSFDSRFPAVDSAKSKQKIERSFFSPFQEEKAAVEAATMTTRLEVKCQIWIVAGGIEPADFNFLLLFRLNFLQVERRIWAILVLLVRQGIILWPARRRASLLSAMNS